MINFVEQAVNMLLTNSCISVHIIQMPSMEAPSKEAEEDDSTESVDETGLDQDEITTVMNQANCSRTKAVKALRKHNNIVDAILELTP